MAMVTERPVKPEVRPILPGTEWMVRRLDPALKWAWRRGFRFLFVLDAIGLFGSMVVINTVRFGVDWPDFSVSYYMLGFAIATAIHLTINYFVGLYEREPRLGKRQWLSRCLLAMAIGVAVQGLAFVLLDRYLMPRLNLGVFLVVGTVVLVLNRRLSRRLAIRREGPPRVVLVGADDQVQRAAAHLGESDRDAVIVGTADRPDGLSGIVAENRATDVLLLDVTAFGAVFPEPLVSLEARGVGFLQRISARETLLGLQGVRQIGGMPFVRLRVHTMPSYKVRLKRISDVVLVVLLAPLWVPVLGLLALYVLLRAGRPVFYRQLRVGRDGELFRVRKFRTMVRDAERHGTAVLAERDDPRVVHGLGWMRETRADEVPQFLNVLRGDMSLVGPRPERPELVTDIVASVPGYVRRLELRPGLTGLAQVNGRYATDAEYKLGYDIQYLVNWSLVLDVQILLRTVWVVLSRRF
jgi:exopolysaccharide biosynthesis polyprenyl glycosylphosphotransferase